MFTTGNDAQAEGRMLRGGVRILNMASLVVLPPNATPAIRSMLICEAAHRDQRVRDAHAKLTAAVEAIPSRKVDVDAWRKACLTSDVERERFQRMLETVKGEISEVTP
jgi:hypothetical protein